MDGFKNVYDTRDLTNLAPMLWPIEKKVFNPYTEVAPPTGANIKITGFNFNTNTWQYIEVATPEDIAKQDEQTTDAMMAIAELYMQDLLFSGEIEALKSEIASLKNGPSDVNDPDVPPAEKPEEPVEEPVTEESAQGEEL